jgi:hypothetical protein
MTLARTDDAVLRRGAWLMLTTDVGFLIYWTLIATSALPADRMFADYDSPAVTAWNWSFLPLDVLASITGFLALRALRDTRPEASVLLPVSLTLTSTAGGMALAFWAISGDLEWSWWLPNAFLLLFPIPLLIHLARHPAPADRSGPGGGLAGAA